MLVAVTDSGIEWNEGQLTNQLFLNQGELPPPIGCPGSDGIKYDVNGDGRFNVHDYTTTTGQKLRAGGDGVRLARQRQERQRHHRSRGSRSSSFSDGKDDDGNGYVDDISGWDFFHDDNDPMDDTGFGHGTGSSKDGFAMPNDGQGGIGTCPDCTAMMLRVGDAFVPELNTWAMAVTYATDIGASVINISGGGGLDNPQLVARRDGLRVRQRRHHHRVELGSRLVPPQLSEHLAARDLGARDRLRRAERSTRRRRSSTTTPAPTTARS